MHVASAKVADDSKGKSNLKSMPKQIMVSCFEVNYKIFKNL